MSRITRDQMFMQIAHVVARRGTCDRARVGAVLTQDNNIVAIGYNGAPSGEPHCDEVGHKIDKGHCIRTIHAEVNCLSKEFPVKEGSWILYVTHFPCLNCVKEIVKFKDTLPQDSTMEVIFDFTYGDTTAAGAWGLSAANVKVRGFTDGVYKMSEV